MCFTHACNLNWLLHTLLIKYEEKRNVEGDTKQKSNVCFCMKLSKEFEYVVLDRKIINWKNTNQLISPSFMIRINRLQNRSIANFQVLFLKLQDLIVIITLSCLCLLIYLCLRQDDFTFNNAGVIFS